MGQKINPTLMRITSNKKKKNWRSIWIADSKDFGRLLLEDEQIRRFLKKRSSCQGASKFTIRRMTD